MTTLVAPLLPKLRGHFAEFLNNTSPVGLAVRLAFAFALSARFPSVLSQPLNASVTLLEATAPVKLPT